MFSRSFPRSLFVAATSLVLAFATSANAVTTASFYDDAATQSGLRFTLSTAAENAFEVLVSQSGNYDSTPSLVGQMFTVHPPNDAKELAFVNNNLVAGDTAFTSLGTKDDSVGNVFTTAAAYVLLKIGGGSTLATALIHNTSGVEQTYTFTGLQASGLSHINQFGSAVSSVPLPAGFLLLLTGMGGLLLVGRGRSKAA